MQSTSASAGLCCDYIVGFSIFFFKVLSFYKCLKCFQPYPVSHQQNPMQHSFMVMTVFQVWSPVELMVLVGTRYLQAFQDLRLFSLCPLFPLRKNDIKIRKIFYPIIFPSVSAYRKESKGLSFYLAPYLLPFKSNC